MNIYDVFNIKLPVEFKFRWFQWAYAVHWTMVCLHGYIGDVWWYFLQFHLVRLSMDCIKSSFLNYVKVLITCYDPKFSTVDQFYHKLIQHHSCISLFSTKLTALLYIDTMKLSNKKPCCTCHKCFNIMCGKNSWSVGVSIATIYYSVQLQSNIWINHRTNINSVMWFSMRLLWMMVFSICFTNRFKIK